MNHRPLLDKVRWLAAVIVAVGHAVAILNDHARGSQALNVLADMRGPAVIIFFVLSGYLVGGIVVRDYSRFQFRRYAIARFSRIYIVLVPAIVLTLLIDGTVYHFDRLNPLFDQIWQGGALGDTPIFSRYGIGHVIASVLCLEPLMGTPMGSAGSFWSLGNEWLYYFALPALFAAGYRLGGMRAATALAFASVIAVSLVSRVNGAFWLVWLGGVYANRVDLAKYLGTGRALHTVKYLGFSLCVVMLVAGTAIGMRAYILGIGAGGFLFLACGTYGESALSHGFDRALARFSYSLYVTHLQVLTLLAAGLLRWGVLPITGIIDPARVLGLALAMLVVCFALAWMMAALFEDRTAQLSRWLERRLAGVTPRPLAQEGA